MDSLFREPSLQDAQIVDKAESCESQGFNPVAMVLPCLAGESLSDRLEGAYAPTDSGARWADAQHHEDHAPRLLGSPASRIIGLRGWSVS
jgi:hypothetical protein